MDREALEKFKVTTIKAVDSQVFMTNDAHKAVGALPIKLGDGDEAVAQNILTILLAGQGAVLLGLSVLLHEDDTEIEIPQAFRDAFQDDGKE